MDREAFGNHHQQSKKLGFLLFYSFFQSKSPAFYIDPLSDEAIHIGKGTSTTLQAETNDLFQLLLMCHSLRNRLSSDFPNLRKGFPLFLSSENVSPSLQLSANFLIIILFSIGLVH